MEYDITQRSHRYTAYLNSGSTDPFSVWSSEQWGIFAREICSSCTSHRDLLLHNEGLGLFLHLDVLTQVDAWLMNRFPDREKVEQ